LYVFCFYFALFSNLAGRRRGCGDRQDVQGRRECEG